MGNFVSLCTKSVFRKKVKLRFQFSSILRARSPSHTYWNSLVLLSSPKLRSGVMCVCVDEETT